MSAPTGRGSMRLTAGWRPRPCPRARHTAQAALGAAVRRTAAAVFPRRGGKARRGGAPLPRGCRGRPRASWPGVEGCRRRSRSCGRNAPRSWCMMASCSPPKRRAGRGCAGASAAPPERPGARRRAAWTGRAGEESVGPLGRPGAPASGRAGVEDGGGRVAKLGTAAWAAGAAMRVAVPLGAAGEHALVMGTAPRERGC